MDTITITPYKEGMDTEQTKREMDIHADGYKQGYKDATEKAIEWFGDYLMELGCPDDWMRDSQAQLSGEEIFRMFMLDHI